MKIWSTEHVFQHPWDVVTAAAWRKYPNDLNPNVKEIDVVERKVTKNGILETTRVFGTTFGFPALLGHFLGIPEICHAIEQVTVDPMHKEMTLRMLNHTFCGMLAVNEKLVYKQSPTDENVTVLEQSASISVTNISFTNYFEDKIVSGFDSNCVKGRDAIENVCMVINTELDELTLRLNTGKDELARKFDEEIDELAKKFDTEVANISSSFDEATANISSSFDEATANISSSFDEATANISSSFDEATKKFDTEVQQISSSLEEASQQISSSIEEAIREAEEAISNIPSPMQSASCEEKCGSQSTSLTSDSPLGITSLTSDSPLGIMDKVLERGFTAKQMCSEDVDL